MKQWSHSHTTDHIGVARSFELLRQWNKKLIGLIASIESTVSFFPGPHILIKFFVTTTPIKTPFWMSPISSHYQLHQQFLILLEPLAVLNDPSLKCFPLGFWAPSSDLALVHLVCWVLPSHPHPPTAFHWGLDSLDAQAVALRQLFPEA